MLNLLKSCNRMALLLTTWLVITSVNAQLFNAVSKHAKLRRRDTGLQPNLDLQTLLYAHIPSEHSTPYSAAKLTLNPKYPTLILEDCDQQIAASYCSEGLMTVVFRSAQSLDMASQIWAQYINFVLISSDPTCTIDGEHGAHLVSYLSADRITRKLKLSSYPVSLKDCTHDMAIDLGSHILPDIDLAVLRRQVSSVEGPTSITASPSVTLASATLASLVPSVTGTTLSQPISWIKKDVTLFGGGSSNESLIEFSTIANYINFKCIDCRMTGGLELKTGGFTIDSNSSLDTFDEFVESGFVEFAAGLDVYLAFELDLLPGLGAGSSLPNSLLSFEPKITPIALSPFGISGVIVFGPMLNLEWPVEVSLNSTVAFQFGYEMKVPDHSRIMVNISNVTNSYSTGFQDTTLKALPFSASAPNLTLDFKAAFRPSIALGVYVGNSELIGVGAGVGAHLDLPALTGRLSVLENYTDDCTQPLPSGSHANKHIYMKPSVVSTGGVILNLDVDLLGYDAVPDGEMELYSVTVLSLPTACLPWDGLSTGIVTAAVASPSASDKSAGNSLVHGLASLRFMLIPVLVALRFGLL